MPHPQKKLLFLALIIALPAIAYSLLPSPNHAALAVFVSTVLLWFTELLPLPVTGLLVPVLIAFYGLMSPAEAFRPFGSDILFLFIGCFFLAHAMRKHGWDKRMAYMLLSTRLGSHSAGSVIAAIGVLSWILGMWVSSTAVVSIMLPIALGIIAAMEKDFPDERTRQHFTKRLLLTCSCTPATGALTTPLSTPPNLLAWSFIKRLNPEFGFLDWLKIGFPLSILMFVVVWGTLAWLYPLHTMQRKSLREDFLKLRNELGPIKIAEIQVLIVFCLAVLGWIAPEIIRMVTGSAAPLNSRLSVSMVGITSAALLFALPIKTPFGKTSTNLTWEDAQYVDWGTVLLFGGGLALGSVIEQMDFVHQLMGFLSTHHLTFALTATGLVVFSVLISEIASNTATAAALLPIIFSAAGDGIFDVETTTILLIACAFGSCFGFMLPVSTPPNAIILGSGLIKQKDLVRGGTVIDLGAIVLISAYLVFVFSLSSTLSLHP